MRPHGVSARYNHGPDENDTPGKGCRCERCTEAQRLNVYRYKAMRREGIRGTVPAQQARRALRELRRYGWTAIAVGRELGLGDPANILRSDRCTRAVHDGVMDLLAEAKRQRAMERRTFPMAPLEAVVSPRVLAERLGIDRTAVGHWRERGVPGRMADAAAVAAGHHPLTIWPDFYDELRPKERAA